MSIAGTALGEQDETEALAHTLTITNHSEGPLVLGRVATDCDCVQGTKLEGKRLEAGESVKLPLKLRLLVDPKADLPRSFDFRWCWRRRGRAAWRCGARASDSRCQRRSGRATRTRRRRSR